MRAGNMLAVALLMGGASCLAVVGQEFATVGYSTATLETQSPVQTTLPTLAALPAQASAHVVVATPAAADTPTVAGGGPVPQVNLSPEIKEKAQRQAELNAPVCTEQEYAKILASAKEKAKAVPVPHLSTFNLKGLEQVPQEVLEKYIQDRIFEKLDIMNAEYMRAFRVEKQRIESGGAPAYASATPTPGGAEETLARARNAFMNNPWAPGQDASDSDVAWVPVPPPIPGMSLIQVDEVLASTLFAFMNIPLPLLPDFFHKGIVSDRARNAARQVMERYATELVETVGKELKRRIHSPKQFQSIEQKRAEAEETTSWFKEACERSKRAAFASVEQEQDGAAIEAYLNLLFGDSSDFPGASDLPSHKREMCENFLRVSLLRVWHLQHLAPNNEQLARLTLRD